MFSDWEEKMKIITLGKKFVNKKHDFREMCFGICERNEQILLTQKINKNEISMVGGGVERGETHEACLRREFMEESGYSVESIAEFCSVDCFWLAGGEWPMESLAHFYLVTLSEKAVAPQEEGHEPLWVEIKDVEKLVLLPYQKEAIKQYLKFKAGC